LRAVGESSNDAAEDDNDDPSEGQEYAKDNSETLLLAAGEE